MKSKRLIILILLCFIFILIFVVLFFLTIRANKLQNASGDASSLPTVIVDAGHGGIDGGAIGIDGTVEKDLNLDIAKSLNQILSFYGFNVIMTRTEDIMVCDKDASSIRQQKVSDIHNRFDIIEANPQAIFVSIHQNKYADSSQWGTQVFYSKNNEKSKALAENIQKAIVSGVQPDNNRIVKKTGTEIYLLYYAKSPAVLVECGFISNYSDVDKLKTDDYRFKMAILIADGIIKYTLNG
jgi:N-acetylmuramoyl-L-alanine amidase